LYNSPRFVNFSSFNAEFVTLIASPLSGYATPVLSVVEGHPDLHAYPHGRRRVGACPCL